LARNKNVERWLLCQSAATLRDRLKVARPTRRLTQHDSKAATVFDLMSSVKDWHLDKEKQRPQYLKASAMFEKLYFKSAISRGKNLLLQNEYSIDLVYQK
jgi:hypothetical protein